MRIYRAGESRQKLKDFSTNDLRSAFTPVQLGHVFGPRQCRSDGHEPVERFPIVDGNYEYRCSCNERVKINERRVRRIAQRTFSMFDLAWAFSQIPGSAETLAVAVKYHASMLFAMDVKKPAPVSDVRVVGQLMKRLVVQDDAMQGSEDLRDLCDAYGMPWIRRATSGTYTPLENGDVYISRTGVRVYCDLAAIVTSTHEVEDALKQSGVGDHTTVTAQEQRRMLDVALCDYVERVASTEVPDWMLASVYERVTPGAYDPLLCSLIAAAYEDVGFIMELARYTDYARVNGKEIKEEEPGLVVVGSTTKDVDFTKATLIGEEKKS